MTAGLELRDLAIGYPARRLRRGPTVTVATGLNAVARRGELTVLLGPNGAGKSTLIRTLCGLQPALGGRVLVDGGDLTELSPDDRARRVAVVLTDRVDAGLLSGRELVGLGRIPHLGWDARLRESDVTVVDWALAAVNADHLASRPVAQMSDGERQRVLTARALAQQPGLLVLDEPTAFLDVSARAGLIGLLRRLARDQQLAIVVSTHDLELALRMADRSWLLGPDGVLTDAVGERLMLSGKIDALFNCPAIDFDPAAGAFTFSVDPDDCGAARVRAPEPLRGALIRILSREGLAIREPAEIVVTAACFDAITVRCSTSANTVVPLDDLPRVLRQLVRRPDRCALDRQVAAMFTELATISSYFEVTTGRLDDTGWRPVAQLYADPILLTGIIDRVGRRIAAPDRLVAASTFQLGFAARLWSIGLGALAGYRLLPDLSPEQLWYCERGGRIRLHLPDPVAWHSDRAGAALVDMLVDTHLQPLTEALRRLGPISSKLLRGNAASALLGAARMFDRHHGSMPGAGWGLARTLCEDNRLSEAMHFTANGTDCRRSSCCLYYRIPGAGLCGDCALTREPKPRDIQP